LDSKKNAPAEEPMFQCIGMLASAVGPNLTKLLHDQLELMFACGLSEPLRQALVAIARHIQPLLKTIQGTFMVYVCSDNTLTDLSRAFVGYAVPDLERSALQTAWRPIFLRSWRDVVISQGL
jgi:phosphatidylinositol kinase/protein kinase (PI-3  family)